MFNVVLIPDEGVDGQQLGEWMAAKFEGPVNVPSFGFAEVVKLLLRCEKSGVGGPGHGRRHKGNHQVCGPPLG